MEALLLLYILIPLATAFIIPVIGRLWDAFAMLITPLAFGILTAMAVLSILSPTTFIYAVGGWAPVNGIPIGIHLVKDSFSTILLMVINGLAFLTSIYAGPYMKKYTTTHKFYTLFCLMVAGMNGVVLTGDLFNLYVFLEIASIASYALVAFGVEKAELEASFKYQVLGGLASLLIMLAISLTYWTTGTLNMADISNLIRLQASTPTIPFIQVLLIAGFGLKAALVPFHAWLPDAHSTAPTPISAMLSGVLIKAIGLYVLFRLLFNVFIITYEISLTILVLGVLSMVIGGLLAIGQQDYKRLLAYSSISQIGYITLGVGLGLVILSQGGDKDLAALAILGGLFHLVNHAVFKGLLFMAAGSIEHATGLRQLDQLGGLSRIMPVTSGTSFIGSMAISGLPPFSGFFSKVIIILAAIQADYYFIALLAVLISIVTLAYFLKLQKGIFYGLPAEGMSKVREAPFTMLLPMLILTSLCLALSLLVIPAIRDALLMPAVDCLIQTTNYGTTSGL